MYNNIIYALQDPRTFEIRYIGLSTKGLARPNEHLKRFTTKKVSSYPIYKWIKKLYKLNLKPNILVIQQFEQSSHLFDAEVYWISYFKTQGSPLLNCTSGGDGVRDMVVTPEFKKKVSETTKIWWNDLDKNIQNKIIKNNLTYRGQNRIKIKDQNGVIYNSLKEASIKIGCCDSAISQAIKENRTCKGYLFTKVIL